MKSRLWLTSGMLLAMVMSAPVGGAGTVLKNAARPVLWQGSVVAGQGPVAEIPECSPGCARFDLAVDLPVDVWNRHGGVQVALRWVSRTLGDNLRLYVYRGGTRIAHSDGIISTAQSVLIPRAANGTFQVYAVYDPDSPNSDIAFEALADVEYSPNVNPVRLLMPDLEVRAHRNLGFDPGGIFFDNISAAHPSCYESEVNEEGAEMCLRFDQIFANVGEGPLELRFAIPHGEFPALVTAHQRRYWSDPSRVPQDDTVGTVEFHAAHEHYHFTSFGVTRLWSVDESNNKKQVVREHRHKRMFENNLVRSGRKVSFCLADIEIDSWAEKGDAPRKYNAPDCLFPIDSDATHDFFVQGISNGWADVYDWYLPDQYMEVSGIADGLYILETLADPDHRVKESNEANNCGGIYVRLSGMGTTPRAEALGPAPKCST